MEKTIGRYKIEVIQDTDPMNPRKEYDNLGTMVCFHNRYDLGDSHDLDIDYRYYSGWKEMKRDIIKRFNAGVVLPLFLYDHSGITISTRPFSCPWDSGQVGFIFISKEKMRYEYSYKRVSHKLTRRVKGYLKAEVETYDQYLTGDVWGYCITNIDTEEEIESCWGYYGHDYCMEEAESIVRNRMKDEGVQLELTF
jgi:hypothetical protein